MRRYVHNKPSIPRHYIEDVKNLREFIMKEMCIDISLEDTYEFWSAFSESWCAGWLSIDTHYDDMTRAEFLEYQMEKFGCILNC